MSQLVPCPHCQRHLRVSETVCPFCAGAITESLETQARPPVSTRGLSRAGILALGASMVVAGGGLLEGCADDDGDDDDNAVPIYGAPVQPDAGKTPPVSPGPPQNEAGPGEFPFDGSGIAIYGAPIQPDAGVDSGRSAEDAGVEEAGRVAPVYGAPVPRDAGKPDAGKGDAGEPDAGRLVPVYGAPVPFYGAPIQPDGEQD